MTEAKKLFVKSYGCQMNVHDSERMAGALAADGYQPVSDAADADLILLNTCHIREKAAEKVYSDIGRLKSLKAARPALRIGVTGCVAQAEGAEILARAPMVDLVVGPQAYHRLPAMLRGLAPGGRAVDTEFPPEDKFDHLPGPAGATVGASAFLTVQEGCDRFCTFCVVPYTRGAESSRPVARILDEARALADRGVREITLLGQNVNAYHGVGPDGSVWSLGRLIRALSGIGGLARLRYTTSHPADMDDDLIAAHAEVPALMPFLHLPVQSGSDRVLKAMNRRHTAETYLRLVERIRAAVPDMALSSDFITGFPGETEGEFADTLALVRAVGFAQAYSFKYSARPGTPAAELPDLPDSIKTDRLHRLQALLTAQQHAFQDSMAGRVLPVLVERPGRDSGQMTGKSPHMLAVHFDAPADLAGQVVDVKVTAALTNSLAGRLAGRQADATAAHGA
jgi:tRNA-2-methylthio-N6-dimethylallyladenosine synthase